MTLVEALLSLKSFIEDLETIIEDIDYVDYSRAISRGCYTLSSSINVIKLFVETRDSILLPLVAIYARLNLLYNNEILSEEFVKRNIQVPNIVLAEEWYINNLENIDQYTTEINALVDECVNKLLYLHETLKITE
jgi:hypothetical protein